MPKVSGGEHFTARINAIGSPDTVQRVGAALSAAGEVIRAEASHMITDGAVSGKNHVPSLPGEPPNEDTGVLRTNIETTQVAPLRVEVSSNAPYAVALEFGTSKMEARPYMGPATRNKRDEVVQLVKGAIDQAVKG